MAIVAIDFGGTTIKAGIIGDGRLLCKEYLAAESENGIKPRLLLVKETVDRMLAKAGLSPASLTGIGIAIPGIVDFYAKRVLDINKKYKDALDFDFEGWCKENFNLPMIIENDIKSAIIGETRYGCCPGAQDAVLLSFGTGIGTAAIINGKLLRGKHHQAGCLGGHIAISDDGNDCTCGGKGCVEAESGGWALPRIAQGFPGFGDSLLAKEQVLDYKAVMSCAAQNDAVSEGIFQMLIRRWSVGLVNLIHAYDPEVVILSGGIMKEPERIVPGIEEYVSRYAWTPWGKVRIHVSGNPDASVLLGLYALCTAESGEE